MAHPATQSRIFPPGQTADFLTLKGVEFVDIPVVVVVGETVVVVVVVGVDVVDTSQSAYSGQLQTFILESK